MSLFSSISILGQALRNFQTAINVTSNNIANANTVGYSREVANFSENSALVMDQLSLGTGANVSSIERLRNIYLDTQVRTELSTLGQYTALNQYASQVASLFPDVGNSSATNGFNAAINNFASSWSNLAANPTSLAAKTQVLNAASTLATMFNQTAQQLYSLHQNLDTQVNDTITQINSDLDQLKNLNVQISQQQASSPNSQPNTLLDAREQVMEKLAQLMDVQFNQTGNGMVGVTFGGGTLLDGLNAYHLSGIPSQTNPGTTDIGFGGNGNGISATDVTSYIHSGQLGGLLQARDVALQQTRLSLNEMAAGIIQRTNELNFSAFASDGTTGHNIFTGNEASDMAVDITTAGQPGYVGATRDAAHPGDIAAIQAAQKDFVLSSEIASPVGTGINGGAALNPSAALSTQTFAFATPQAGLNSVSNPGQFVIASGGNSVTIKWGNDQSINQIIANINAASGGAFYATFDQTNQRVIIVGKTPLTVYDQVGNLGQVFGLGSLVTSSAPINNSPAVGLNQVNIGQSVSSTQNLLDLYTKALTSGTGQVDSSNFNWTKNQTLTTILLNLRASTPAGAKVYVSFNAANQTISLYKPGYAPANALLTQANPLVSISVGDLQGNFTQFANFQTNQSLDNLYGSLTSNIASQQANYNLFATQAQNSVSNLQAVQNSISQVDVNQEVMNAQALQRSYEASIRVQEVIDEMLNVLINGMGSPSTGGTNNLPVI